MITGQEVGRSRRALVERPRPGKIGSGKPAWTSLDTDAIGGLAVATATRQQLVDAAVADCRVAYAHGGLGPPRLVFDVNGQALSMYETNRSYRAAVASADIVHADGAFVVTASRLRGGKRIAERSATTDMIHDFAARAAKEDLSFFLLGGTEEVNALCAKRLLDLYPGLQNSSAGATATFPRTRRKPLSRRSTPSRPIFSGLASASPRNRSSR